MLTQDGVPSEWMEWKKGQYAQVFGMAVWAMAAVVLTSAYLSMLLSSLTIKEYEEPIDKVENVLEKGYGFLVPGGTRISLALKKDPRPAVKALMQNHLIEFPFRGFHPPWVIEM